MHMRIDLTWNECSFTRIDYVDVSTDHQGPRLPPLIGNERACNLVAMTSRDLIDATDQEGCSHGIVRIDPMSASR